MATKKAATKKTTGKKAAGKKTATKKTTGKKSAGKKTAETSSEQTGEQPAQKRTSGSARGRTAARAEAQRPKRASQVAASAASELLELTGKQAEGIIGLERVDDGWVVQVEVVEVRRIPDTTDVLALYEVNTDGQGGLLGYRRLRRYARGVPGDD